MKNLTTLLLLMMLGLWSCSPKVQEISITYSDGSATVMPAECYNISIKVDGSHVSIHNKSAKELSIMMQGSSNDGTLKLKTDTKAKIRLNGLSLTSQNGAPISIKNKKKVDIVAIKGSENTLCVAACPDTSAKQAVIWSKAKLYIRGKGKLDVLAKADGCKGINSKGDIKIEEITLNVITTGQNLGKDTSNMFGFGGMPPFGPMPEGMEFPKFDSFPPFGEGFPPMGEGFPPMGEGFPPMGEGFPPMGEGFPPMGEGFPPMGEGFPDFGGMPPFGGMGGFGESGDPDETIKGGFKQRYIATTKAIKANGTVTINSGKIYCKTSSAGAEGIEGKKGVTINGGKVTVDAIDDAINANATITFNGGVVIAESHCNDAVDANIEGGFPGFPPMGGQGNGSDVADPKSTGQQDAASTGSANPKKGKKGDKGVKPGVIISGGKVFAYSHVGAPEEGIDCDFAPLMVSGGTVFTIGAGMGELPSVPTAKTARQATVVFTGLSIEKGETIEVAEGNKVIFRLEAPFSFKNSSSMFTCKGLKKGKSYTLRSKDGERKFTMDEKFMTVRK